MLEREIQIAYCDTGRKQQRCQQSYEAGFELCVCVCALINCTVL